MKFNHILSFTFLLSCTLFFSCAMPLVNHQASTQEPTDAFITANSFVKEQAIFLTWPDDKAADEYYLYRDQRPDGAFSERIYAGKENFYMDSNLLADNFYYYKLAKRRGPVVYNKSPVTHGIATLSIDDAYENNNDKKSAVVFDNFQGSGEISANIYYYRDAYKNAIEDQDWFYVDIQGRRERTYVLAADPRGGGLQDNDIFFQEEYGPEVYMSAKNGTNIKITNLDYTPKRIYFAIRVNQSNFLSGTSGGRTGYYTLRFVSENQASTP